MHTSVKTALGAALLAITTGAQAAPFLFTNAGASGTLGPTQVMVDAAYTGTNLDGDVTVVSTGIQTWTVQQTGTYALTASGASGGSTTRATAGRGASITTNVFLTAGEQLSILVGQLGGFASFGGPHGGETGGGGGGSFVVDAANNPLLVAGGGGGAAEGLGGYSSYVANGTDASDYSNTSGQDGTSTAGSWSSPGVGGTGGNGGTRPGFGGAGGGGFFTDGAGSGSYAGDGGVAFISGGAGGANIMHSGTFIDNILGGYGGGGGAGTHQGYESNAGGGGGYSGGGGGNTRVGAGGGGGNFYTGDFMAFDYNIGHGMVSVELIEAASLPAPATLALLAVGLLGVGAAARSSRSKNDSKNDQC